MPLIYQSNNKSNSLRASAIKVERKHIKDAYFAVRKDEPVYEGTPSMHTVVSGDTLSKIANNNSTTVAKIKADNGLTSDLITVGQELALSKATKKGDKVSFTKIKEAKVGEEVYIVVKTKSARELELKINIKQGVEDGVAKMDEAIIIQQEDKNTDCIKATVGDYCKEEGITNKDDFADWAIAKVVLQPKGTEKQKEWSDALDCLQDKKSKLYILVDAHSDNDYHITYHGRNPDDEGKPDYKTCPNRWLDIDEKWFELKLNDCCTRDITKEQLKNIATYGSDSNIEEHLTGINESFKDNDINTCLRKLHYLAQLIHESGSFQYTEELGVDEAAYGGFKGRGLIQLTFESNYKDYGEFVNDDVTSTQENKEKLEGDPHAAKSAGWYWGQRAKLNDEADDNDFIYITYAVNGGYNGYNDRLEWVEKGFEELYNKCKSKKNHTSIYSFSDSKAYNSKKASFGWGLWHDPDLNKTGCTKNKNKAIEGYERFISLHDAAGTPTLTTKWYGYQGSDIRSTVENRLTDLKDESPESIDNVETNLSSERQ